MRHDGLHVHACCHCKTPVECHGEQVRNHDGAPEVICLSYHRADGTITPWLCEYCYSAAQRSECHDCGEPAVHVFEDSDDASGYRGEIGLCNACLSAREAKA